MTLKTRKRKRGGRPLPMECAICLNPLVAGESVAGHITSGNSRNHFFHTECLERHCSHTRNQCLCPLCRIPIYFPTACTAQPPQMSNEQIIQNERALVNSNYYPQNASDIIAVWESNSDIPAYAALLNSIRQSYSGIPNIVIINTLLSYTADEIEQGIQHSYWRTIESLYTSLPRNQIEELRQLY